MANAQVFVKSNLPEENKTSTKTSADTESSPVKRTTYSSCSLRKKPEGRVIVNDEEAEKNNVSNRRVTRRSKNKINLDKKEHVVTKKDEKKGHANRYKSLDDYENWHLSSTASETHINKENQATNSNKHKVFSPNHKVTEYFLGLKLDDSGDRDVHDKQDLEQKETRQDHQDTTKPSSILCPKQPSLSGTPSKSAKRRLRLRKARLNSTESTNHKLTEYYQVRRSERKYKKNILDEKQRNLENKILKELEDGLEVIDIEGKGRGVVTTKDFFKGDFVVEYIGDLIDGATARIREAKYARNKNIGCYMYYFKFKNMQYCIDATKESGKLGRLVNHSRKGNLVSKVIEIDQTPHLVLFAKTDIPAGIELLYDYGDRSKESVKHHPWLTL
ncbi:hypothetical protein TSAR_016711 [Trichomalopsis sarcophagae]|uniref:[histone H4]-lysine(20) N-methyltransferase n=1 Tax=Trichomalopsis sarcophagae TaxID=543379 RepID=A0A232FHR3_9HYME|nr:hypothetical protein TSAR_016711 [Trichomalopsis sarcophagae]